jgi:ABC-2 type transport system permease protein
MKTPQPLLVMLSIAWKDLRILLKDRGFLMIMFGIPLVMSMLMGSIYNQSSSGGNQSITFPVVLVNQDAGDYGKQIADILKKIDVLKITPMDSAVEAEKQVSTGKALAAIVIPTNLTQQVDAYKPSTVQVITDPVQQQYASIVTGIMNDVVEPIAVQGEISHGIRSLLAEYPGFLTADAQTQRAYEAQNFGVIMTQVQKMESDPWIKVETQTLTGAKVTVPANLFTLFVPGFTVMFAFFIVGAMATDILQEKREGTLRRLIAAPLPRWVIIAGKMLAYLAIPLLQVIIIFGVANVAFAMPFGSSVPGLLLVTLATGLAATGIGMLVAALSRSEQQANSIGMVLGFLLAGLGGCFIIGSLVPLYRSGGVMETISRFTPQAHALEAYQMLLNEGAGVLQVMPSILILLGFAVVSLLIAAWRLKLD